MLCAHVIVSVATADDDNGDVVVFIVVVSIFHDFIITQKNYKNLTFFFYLLNR